MSSLFFLIAQKHQLDNKFIYIYIYMCVCVCACVGNVNRQRFIAFSATSLHFLASENGSGAGMPRRMLLKLFVHM